MRSSFAGRRSVAIRRQTASRTSRGVSTELMPSRFTPRATRLAVWGRSADDLRPARLDRICTKVVPFAELPAQFDDYIKGRVTGRAVVKIA